MSKLNKYHLLGIIFVSVLSFSACVPTKTKEQDQTQTQSQAMEEMKEMAQAVERGESVHCKLVSDDGQNLEYWIKGKKVKAQGGGLVAPTEDQEADADLEKMGYMINDAEFMYMWSEGESEGVKMKMPSEEELKEMAEDAEEFAESMPDFTDEEVISEYEDQGYKVSCQVQNVSDNEFTVPSNVMFRDMSAMMEEAQEMGEQMMQNFDEGDMDAMQKMAEEMEKKYGN